MSSKRVLIVDDSRSARHVLKRQLVQYGITVDEVESAEDGLQYLLYNKPHAIFMDHMMPGMDGLQAVRIIKGNPATGLIPIMMYTSKDGGEVYVGQARALGAVGVLPKEIKSVDLEAVLHSLHLLDDSPFEHPPVDDHLDEIISTPPPKNSGKPVAAGLEAAPGPAQLSERELESLARDAADDAMVRLLRPHLDAHARRLQASFKAELRSLVENMPAPAVETPRSRWPAAAAGLVLGVLLVGGASKMFNDAAAPESALAPVSLGSSVAAAPPAGLSLASMQLNAAAEPQRDESLLRALEWAINRDGRFAQGATPFDDSRLRFIEELAARLQAGGFEGVMHLTAHAGSFCMVPDDDGTMRMAADDVPVTECQDFGLEAERLQRTGELESVAFASLANRKPLFDGTRLRMVVEAAAEPEPRMAYPPIDEQTLAGDWNAIAAQNQRIEVRLVR
ncbi:response regulator [Halopseudomonas nanhaiensis]|uniref:response regulator n=1 Tax=Halopseudomonas nanhaiensis TaxID=2830842 RepID=UPI001CBDCAF2|nr:response regulator [Halopseudomonas nanhaiensis]UAW99655.1 response regulator [Halopseudomonas nanhaiensis]